MPHILRDRDATGTRLSGSCRHTTPSVPTRRTESHRRVAWRPSPDRGAIPRRARGPTCLWHSADSLRLPRRFPRRTASAAGSGGPCRSLSRAFPSVRGRCRSRSPDARPVPAPFLPPWRRIWGSSPVLPPAAGGNWRVAGPSGWSAKRCARCGRRFAPRRPSSPAKRRSMPGAAPRSLRFGRGPEPDFRGSIRCRGAR